ncbi:MAG: hypothetical protein IKX36_04320 [Prevotella sp.]|nr:hypothetical protein [Prevotella sp.]
MKKYFYIFASIALFSLTLSGCQKSKESAPAATAGSEDQTTISADEPTGKGGDATEESFEKKKVKVTKHDNKKNIDLKIEIDYPVSGPEKALQSTREYIMEQLVAPMVFMPGDNKQKPQYTGDLNDKDALAEFYAQAWMDYLSEDWDDNCPGMEVELDIERVESNNLYVSYEAKAYQYMGGAHPTREQRGMTFRLSDGKQITKFFDKTPEDIIKKLIAEDVDTEAKQSVLNGGLPNTSPYLADGSLKYVYQEGEIASNSLGTIEAEIDLGEIIKYFNDEAKALFKDWKFIADDDDDDGIG